MKYEVIESKLNRMSLEELEMHDPNTFGVITNKLLHIALNPSKLHMKEVFKFADSLANNDSGQPNNRIAYKSYIRQDKTTKSWIASRTIKGERYKKVDKYRDIVEEWYKQLCLEHEITP